MFCPGARYIYLQKVLVISRMLWLCPDMTEKLFTGTLSKRKKQTKKTTKKKKKQHVSQNWSGHPGSVLPFFLHFLAYLSRRLIGELIVYQWSGVRRPSVRRPSVRRPQCSKIFFSETAGPVKAKFYVKPPWVGGTIFFFAASGSHDQDGRHANIW